MCSKLRMVLSAALLLLCRATEYQFWVVVSNPILCNCDPIKSYLYRGKMGQMVAQDSDQEEKVSKQWHIRFCLTCANSISLS